MTLAVEQVLLDQFAATPLYEGPTLVEQLTPVADRLSLTETQRLYGAWGDLLPLLAHDPQIAQVALDTAVQMDIYEAAAGALALTRRLPTAWACLACASLIAHPAVPARLRRSARDAFESYRLDDAINRAISIRLDPRAESLSDLDRLAAMQSWPGLRSRDLDSDNYGALAPVVYLAMGIASRKEEFQLALALSARGAVVRRLPIDDPLSERLPVELLSNSYPIVLSDRNLLTQLQQRGVRTASFATVIVDRPLSTVLSMSRALNRIDAALPKQQKLRPARREVLLSDAGPLSPQSIMQGAFDTSEVAYLGSARKRMVYDYAKEGLTPLSGDVRRWSFQQLIAVRIVQYFKTQSRKVVSPAALVSLLSEAVARTATSRVGVAADGAVFIEHDEGYTNIQTGQPAMSPVVELDAVFQPIQVGGGHVPALLQPSAHTLVHPARQSGTPTIAGTRLTARSIAELAQENGIDSVYRTFEEVPASRLLDAARVGSDILNTQ